MTLLACSFCGQPVDPKRYCPKIEGWEKPGRGLNGRSGSSVVLRERVGEVAHPECVAARRAGVIPHQGTLA